MMVIHEQQRIRTILCLIGKDHKGGGSCNVRHKRRSFISKQTAGATEMNGQESLVEPEDAPTGRSRS